MTTSSAPASGGSTFFGFVLIAIAVLIGFAFFSSVSSQVGPVSPHLLTPAPAPTPTPPAATAGASAVGGVVPAPTPTPDPAVSTPPVYLPQPTYRDEGYEQNDEVPSHNGTIRINRSSGAFRAEGAESIANALLLKERIATQGQQDFNAALARPIVTQTVVQTVQVPVLVAPIPISYGCCRPISRCSARTSCGRLLVYSGGYWHF